MIHVFGVLLNSKINKVMARKKKVEEEQPVTAEVVETKKKSSRKHTGNRCSRADCQRRKYERFF